MSGIDESFEANLPVTPPRGDKGPVNRRSDIEAKSNEPDKRTFYPKVQMMTYDPNIDLQKALTGE